MKKTRFLSILIAFVLFLESYPVYADEVEPVMTEKTGEIVLPERPERVFSGEAAEFYLDRGDILLTDTESRGYDAEGDPVTADADCPIVIRQNDPEESTSHGITIEGGVHAIELRDLFFEGESSFMEITEQADVTLGFFGENVLLGDSKEEATIRSTEGSYLEFSEDSSGLLSVETNGEGAAIGGKSGENSGTVEVNGGEIRAYTNGTLSKGYGGCAIGGGHGKQGGLILINDGKVYAENRDGSVSFTSAIGASFAAQTELL